MMDELKSCPFCGGEAKMKSWYIHGIANKKHYKVECSTSGCIAQKNEYKSKDRAANEWNKRVCVNKQSTNKDCIEADISVFIDMQPLYEIADGYHEIDVVKYVENFITAYVFTANDFLVEETTKRLQHIYNSYLFYRSENKDLFLDKELISFAITDYIRDKNNWNNEYTENMYNAVFCNLVLIFQLCDEDFVEWGF